MKLFWFGAILALGLAGCGGGGGDAATDTAPPAGTDTPAPGGTGTPPSGGTGTPPSGGTGTPPSGGTGTPPTGQAPTPSWQAAALLETSNDFNVSDTNTFADAPVLSAMNASGQAVVVWEQSDGTPSGTTRKVFSRRYAPAQGWAAAVEVPGITTTSASTTLVSGKLLLDDAGQATWVRQNFETRRQNSAGTWVATVIAPARVGLGELDDAKLDASGNVHILGLAATEVVLNKVLYNQLGVNANAWGAWVDLNATTRDTRQARLALSANGTALAIWAELNPGDNNYSVKTSRQVGGTWQAAVRIEEVLTDVSVRTPSAVAMDSSGNAIAAWTQGESIYTNRFDAAAGTWGTATLVERGLIPWVGMTGDGRAVLTWQTTGGYRWMNYAPGAGFNAPATASTNVVLDQDTAIDQQGRVMVTYRTLVAGADTNLASITLPWGGTWSAPQRMDQGGLGDVKDNVACASNALGTAVCAWAQDDLPSATVRNSLWAAVRR
jgi:hypothetical protein